MRVESREQIIAVTRIGRGSATRRRRFASSTPWLAAGPADAGPQRRSRLERPLPAPCLHFLDSRDQRGPGHGTVAVEVPADSEATMARAASLVAPLCRQRAAGDSLQDRELLLIDVDRYPPVAVGQQGVCGSASQLLRIQPDRRIQLVDPLSEVLGELLVGAPPHLGDRAALVSGSRLTAPASAARSLSAATSTSTMSRTSTASARSSFPARICVFASTISRRPSTSASCWPSGGTGRSTVRSMLPVVKRIRICVDPFRFSLQQFDGPSRLPDKGR